MQSHKAMLVIISAPSGGGKDAVANELVKIFPGAKKFITTTSRPMRPGNQEGVDYNFISPEEFEKQIKEGNFLEYNYYNGNYYGTPRGRLEKELAENAITFLVVDTNGKKNIDRAGIPNFSIFLLPENEDVLKERIQKRGGLNADQVEERLATARREIKESETYDFRVVNAQGKLGETVAKAAEAIRYRLQQA